MRALPPSKDTHRKVHLLSRSEDTEVNDKDVPAFPISNTTFPVGSTRSLSPLVRWPITAAVDFARIVAYPDEGKAVGRTQAISVNCAGARDSTPEEIKMSSTPS